MKSRNLRRRLTAWDRYSRRLEKLGQSRLYSTHIYYIGVQVIDDLRRGRHHRFVEVGPPVEGYTLDCCNLDEIVKEAL